MKIIYSILALLLVVILMTWSSIPDVPENDHLITSLPWIIETDNQGGSRVFGLEIGTATVRQAQILFNDEAKLAVFEDRNGKRSLEAFFNYTQIAGLQAHITLTLQATPDMLETLTSQAIEKKAQASNSYKLLLPAGLNETLLDHPFNSLTYQPKISIAPDILQARFGQPDTVILTGETIQQWLYPAKGLSLLVAENAKPVFQYVRPDQFSYYFGQPHNRTKYPPKQSN